MPSHLHEVLIDMFRNRPSLAADLLAGPLGVDVPTFQKAHLSACDVTDIAPTEYRADTVVTLDGFGQGVVRAKRVVRVGMR